MPLQAKSEDKRVLLGDEARNKIYEGVREVYEVAKTTYGPVSANVAVELNWGKPTVTKDGITAIRRIMFRDRAKNMGAQLLIEASQRTNDYVGDGTTATVILAHHLIEAARKRIASGYNVMALRKGLNDAAAFVIDKVRARAVQIKDKDLHKIATISASDEAIGKLIAQTLIDAGENGGVTVEEYQGIGIDSEIVNGFHFETGYHAAEMATEAGIAKYEGIAVLVGSKPLSKLDDIMPLLQVMEKDQIPSLLIVGEVSGEALQVLVRASLDPRIVNKFVSVNPPVYGQLRPAFYQDVAAYTGATVMTSLAGITPDDLGQAEKVIVTAEKTTITGGAGDDEAVKARIDEVQQLLKQETTNEFLRERYSQRLARLTGKLAVIRVGGATETEAKELKFRVDDAVAATRAARAEGVVPGGGTTLVRLSADTCVQRITRGQKTDDEYEGWLIVEEALKQPLLTLCSNAGEDGTYRLRQVMDSPDGYGFDLKNPTEEPVDLIKAGVVDPAKVIRMVVENAVSVASNVISCNAAVIYEDTE